MVLLKSIFWSLSVYSGTEWNDAYGRIEDANGGDLTEFRKLFNARGKLIQNQGHKGFLEQTFQKYYNKDFDLIKTISLSSILCTQKDRAYINNIFAGFVQATYKKLARQTSLPTF